MSRFYAGAHEAHTVLHSPRERTHTARIFTSGPNNNYPPPPAHGAAASGLDVNAPRSTPHARGVLVIGGTDEIVKYWEYHGRGGANNT